MMVLLSLRRMLVFALATGWLVAGRATNAQTPAVRDMAGLFQPETVLRASEEIRQIQSQHGKGINIVIETFDTVPRSWFFWSSTNKVNSMSEDARNQYFMDWARKRAYPNSLYVLICKDPLNVQVVLGRGENIHKAFHDDDCGALRDSLLSRCNQKDYDGGLLASIDSVRETLDARLGITAGEPNAFTWDGMLRIILSILTFWLFMETIKVIRGDRLRTGEGSNCAFAFGAGGSILTDLFAVSAGSRTLLVLPSTLQAKAPLPAKHSHDALAGERELPDLEAGRSDALGVPAVNPQEHENPPGGHGQF